jgi:ATP-binding cassette, subfamily G (WHITE), member 2, PDR
VAIYQAPQAAYDLFDKATVLYEGHQIYFGRADQAKQYFIRMGFECPDGQTDADFLTSMTSPNERIIRAGFHNRVPRTSDDFATAWKNSLEYQCLMESITEYDRSHPIGGKDLENFQDSRKSQQAKHQRLASPYTLSYGQQIRLCLWRGMVRLKADPSLTFTQLFGNAIMALITGSIFYDLNSTTDSFFSRGALIFFVVIMNAFGSVLEILLLYDQRAIVEKHDRYALYHPSAEAFASMLTDIPYKILNTFTFNIPIYFMTNLRREAGPFFFFLLISFLTTLVMSKIFRTIASVSRTLHQALAPAAVVLLAIIIYTGFVIPTTYMLGWSRWINYINPVAYAFEALMTNEFSGREFPCPEYSLIPQYGELPNRICTVVGSVPGKSSVSGDVYLDVAFSYYASNEWRNVGIVIAFTIGLMGTYLVAAEYVSPKKSKGEVLVFPRGQAPAALTQNTPDDIEAIRGGGVVKVEKQGSEISTSIQRQTAIFQ